MTGRSFAARWRTQLAGPERMQGMALDGRNWVGLKPLINQRSNRRTLRAFDFIRGENGAQSWNRTSDTAIFSRMLYQLSYLGAGEAVCFPVGGRGIMSRSGAVQSLQEFCRTIVQAGRAADRLAPAPPAFACPPATANGRVPRGHERCSAFLIVLMAGLAGFCFVHRCARDDIAALQPAAEIDIGAA